MDTNTALGYVREFLRLYWANEHVHEAWSRELESEHQWGRLAAAIVLDEMDDQAKPALSALKAALKNQPNKYIVRVANRAVNDLEGTNHQVP